ncbi:hypothetical protein ILUMI_00005 [Ignelater luminosus]|uniref:Uncharacterized protein n=1 Tax=Ignelater luminosus TaxID=2038154 RepID=A0A8K0DMG3_IGNLU|nr:hypothetical protein ILUMI_00005 [Ignelater luminosus]
MMLKVSKCCFCCDLKYGFITFTVISLICRVIAITIYWGVAAAASNIPVVPNQTGNIDMSFNTSVLYSVSVTPGLGYILATTVLLIIALRGIIMEKSILIFPYIVVLVLEIIANTLLHFCLVAVVSAFFLISLIISDVAEAYILLCLWNLYKEITRRERPTGSIDFTYERAVV